MYLWNIRSFPVDLKCLVNQVFLCWDRCSIYNARSLSWQTLRNNCDFLKFVWITWSVSDCQDKCPVLSGWLIIRCDIPALAVHHSLLLGTACHCAACKGAWGWILPTLVAQSEEPLLGSWTFGHAEHGCCKNGGTWKLLFVNMKCNVYHR